MEEIIANSENIPFLLAVKNAKVGDIIKEKFGDLTVVADFTSDGGTYEERMKENVLYRETFGKGKVLRKSNSFVVVFVSIEDLAKVN